MNPRYWPCFGVKSRRESAARFIVVLNSGVSAMNIRYRVDLSDIERTQLSALLNGGKHAARKIKRAQILLAADAGVSDDVIASSLSVGGSTVYRTKRRFVQGNLELALSEGARPGANRKLSGKEAALLIATACSNPPEGRKRWTLDLLAGAMVRLTDHEGVWRVTVRRRLAEDDLKPWRGDMVGIPPLGWGICLISMPRSLTRTARLFALMIARHSSSARCASQSRLSQVSRSVTI